MGEKQELKYNTYNSPRAPTVLYRTTVSYDNGSDVSNGAGGGAYIISPSDYRDGDMRNAQKVDMIVPKPCCSNKVKCVMMVLVNLVIILAILGFLIWILIPFFEPIYLWIFGAIFLVFGFFTLLVTIKVHRGVQSQAVNLT